MKKLIILLILCTFVCTEMKAQTVPPVCNDIVTIQGKYFQCGGELFYPLATTYAFHVLYPGTGYDINELFLSRANGYGNSWRNSDGLHDGNFYCYGYSMYEDQDSVSCHSRIISDLTKIHQMGFNTIRTTFGARFDSINDQYLKIYTAKCTDGTWVPMQMDAYDSTNAALNKMFGFYGQILQDAHDCDLKVFLDIAYKYTISSTSNYNTYLEYLRLLALYIDGLSTELKQTLIAYVILEECGNTQVINNDKSDICTKVSTMYDVLHDNDPNHLVSVGGVDISDVTGWDPGVMKLDFFCPHLYPRADTSLGENNSDHAVERVLGQMYWLKNNSTLPWVIGECGFGATDDNLGRDDPDSTGWPWEWDCGHVGFPVVDGELQYAINGETYTQVTFADSVLKMVRDCGGSGFTMWDFQEIWGANPYVIPVGHPDVNGDCHGLLRHGESGNTYADGGVKLLEKPVVEVFRDYLDANGQPPAIDPNGGKISANEYYNPFHTNYNTIIDTVYDQNGDPVKDAFVYGFTDWGGSGTKDNYLFHTFTEASGRFTIKSYHNLLSGTFDHIQISYPGASVEDRSFTNYFPYPYTLNLSGPNANETYTGTINNGQSKTIAGRSTLTTGNATTINSGGTADFHARDEVNVNNEFHACTGSEVHIYCMVNFADCDSIVNKSYNPYVDNNKRDKEEENKEIEVDFAKRKDAFNINVYPNPNEGSFNLELKEECLNCTAEISDILGNILLTKTITAYITEFDLSTFGRGIYFLKVYNDKKVKTEKIIYQ
jgi:hypothetical protein